MGYREDVAIVCGEAVWQEIEEAVQAMGDSDRDLITTHIQEADEHRVNDDGVRFLFWTSIRTMSQDVMLLTKLLNSLASIDEAYDDEWLMVCVGEDGATEYSGCYFQNPFGVGVVHQITYGTNDSKCVKDEPCKWVLAATEPRTVSAGANIKPVNNHTCTTCGNTACNKQESSCWKCGTAIK
jgi:hypothetical protein